MDAENTISDFVVETQVAIFDYARTELQKPLKRIAADCRVPYATVQAWASGRNGLTLYAVKVLLRAPYMAPLLSRLFEPEEYALIGAGTQSDHDDLAAKCLDFAATTAAARHPESECREKFGPNEKVVISTKRAALRVAA